MRRIFNPGMGQPPGMSAHGDPAYANYNIIPAWYVITIELGGAAGASQPGTVPLRPEPFVCYRITWATTGDTLAALEYPGGAGLNQGRAVEILWGDEFTKFMGERAALLSAVFGDSNGFLDIPEGLQFEGRQTLSARLTRVLWPSPESEEQETRFDIVFHGIGLLSAGMQASGTP